ncbi:MAG: hypothetical protein K8Q97_04415 [Candidatus Andersenbacteria bacterium]|nr:hypothetical protein [Candidatus Andersenbacteria bacterium]
MYLDTSERGEMKALVGGFYVRWYIRRLDEISGAHMFRVTIAALLYVCVVFAVAFLSQVSAYKTLIVFVALALMILIVNVSDRYRKKRTEEEIDSYPPESWDHEIEQLEVTSQERELFLRLLEALRGESKEEFRDALDQALQSPALSKLRFIRELDYVS